MLVNGINNVAFVTPDIDRLADFYKRIFDEPEGWNPPNERDDR